MNSETRATRMDVLGPDLSNKPRVTKPIKVNCIERKIRSDLCAKTTQEESVSWNGSLLE